MQVKFMILVIITLISAGICHHAVAQAVAKTGSIYGVVEDDQGKQLPGVSVTLESNTMPARSAHTGISGVVYFPNLPPGLYTVVFSLQGFTELRQENVQVTIGAQVQLQIALTPSLKEEVIVVAKSRLVDTSKTGSESTYTRDSLQQVPSGRDPWAILDQTGAVDVDRVNVAGSESGNQSQFFARGESSEENLYVYEGINVTDPIGIGGSSIYYDFDALEEMQILTGAQDASILSGGVVVNLVTRRGGSEYEASASYYFVDDGLQGSNTPEELLEAGVERSNRIDRIYDVGFDLGGPIVKDKLFGWGAFRKNQIDLLTRTGLEDNTTLTNYNLKLSFHASDSQELQFAYYYSNKTKLGRGFSPAIQAPETLWDQGPGEGILEGIWTFQYSWIPNDHTLLYTRYGYIGLSSALAARGGTDVPVILLNAIPRYESTFSTFQVNRPAHDVNVDVNYLEENWLGGDHEFKFGFEYKTATGESFLSYGNGLFMIDLYQTEPGGSLTSGILSVGSTLNGNVQYDRTSLYITDTFRKERLTLKLGVRMDHTDGKNNASSIPAVEGFEEFLLPFDYPGSDMSPSRTHFSPRIGATYQLTEDGKTLIRANFARYYQVYDPVIEGFYNPTLATTGADFLYFNRNGDREIQPDEIVAGPFYFGGRTSADFDLAAFEAARLIDDDLTAQWTNEWLFGFEREVMNDLALSVFYTYRKYDNFGGPFPFGVTADDFVPAGVFEADTELGSFTVPYSTLGFVHDGTRIAKNVDGFNITYHGIDIAARKRMSNNFLFNASFILQKQQAHYEGPETFFVTQTGGLTGSTFADPALVQFYDGQIHAWQGQTGVFPFSEWKLKASGVYLFPWDLSAGAFLRYQQGYTQPLFGGVIDRNLSAFYGTRLRLIPVEPVGDRRYDNLFTLDLSIQKGFDLKGFGRITAAIEIFNLTNSNAVLQRQRRVNSQTFNNIEENLSPRAIRLGIRYTF